MYVYHFLIRLAPTAFLGWCEIAILSCPCIVKLLCSQLIWSAQVSSQRLFYCFAQHDEKDWQPWPHCFGPSVASCETDTPRKSVKEPTLLDDDWINCSCRRRRAKRRRCWHQMKYSLLYSSFRQVDHKSGATRNNCMYALISVEKEKKEKWETLSIKGETVDPYLHNSAMDAICGAGGAPQAENDY